MRFELPIFEVADGPPRVLERLTIAHALVFAIASESAMSSFFWQARLGLACLEAASVETRARVSSEVSARREAWRRSRGLHAAADAEKFLNSLGIEHDALTRYLIRQGHRSWANATIDAAGTAPERTLDAFPKELVLGGALRGLVQAAELGFSVALACERSPTAHAMNLVEQSLSTHEVSRAMLADAFRLPLAEVDVLLAFEALVREERARVATVEAMERELHRRRSELVRIEYRAATFATRELAYEVIASVRVDGDSFEERVGAHGRWIDRGVSTVAELSSDARLAFLCVLDEGAVHGPIAAGDAWGVYEVTARIAPSLEDEHTVGALAEDLFSKANARKCLALRPCALDVLAS